MNNSRNVQSYCDKFCNALITQNGQKHTTQKMNAHRMVCQVFVYVCQLMANRFQNFVAVLGSLMDAFNFLSHRGIFAIPTYYTVGT